MKISDVADRLGAKLLGDGAVEITGAGDLAGAAPGDLSFVQAGRYLEEAKASRASAFLVPPGLRVPGKPCLEVPNPKIAFITVLSEFMPEPPLPRGIHARAVVEEGAEVGEGVFVGAGAVVESGAVLGRGARVGPGSVVGQACRVAEEAVLHPSVVLYRRTTVGRRSVVHAGSVLGADGFGYVQEGKSASAEGAIERYQQAEGPHRKVPQLGWVEVGEDVEIGASVTVDRGTVGPTVIGRGTKIDNQLQIGHNVRIGEDVIIVAEVGIGGSVTVGDHVTIGGNCGIAEGCVIGSYCIVGAHTLMYPGKTFSPRTVIFGNPAREASRTREMQIALAGLPRSVRRLGKLEERVAALESQ